MPATALPAADELEPLVLTIYEAASVLRVSAYTVRRLIWDGKLPARKVGNQWRIRPEDVHKLAGLEAPANGAKPKPAAKPKPPPSAKTTAKRTAKTPTRRRRS